MTQLTDPLVDGPRFAGHPFPLSLACVMTQAMTGVTTNSSLARQELAALLAQVACGERTALAQVYDRTSAKLYGICLRLLGSEADAEDALQDAYLTVWRSAESFQAGRSSPITWLALIARSRAIDLRRRRKAPTEPVEAAEAIPDERAGAVDLLVAADEQSRLHQCLNSLDERARRMIRSAFLDGLTYPDLASREGVPLGTMKSWLRRGLIRLRGCMEA
jgi:RNA polymerase sigma-70 factor (ECF subfamily)